MAAAISDKPRIFVGVLTYGLSSSGDWLQPLAASLWLVANIASVATAETN